MVTPRGLPPLGSDADDEAYYEQLQEQWPAQRSSLNKRSYQRKRDRRVEVVAERRELPSTARMSKALLAAQREIAKLQAEVDAQSDNGRKVSHDQ